MKPWHIAVLIVVLILLFGTRRLPDIAKSIGQSLKVFKKEVTELQQDSAEPVASPAPPAAIAPVVPPNIQAPPTSASPPVAPPPAAVEYPRAE